MVTKCFAGFTTHVFHIYVFTVSQVTLQYVSREFAQTMNRMSVSEYLCWRLKWENLFIPHYVLSLNFCIDIQIWHGYCISCSAARAGFFLSVVWDTSWAQRRHFTWCYSNYLTLRLPHCSVCFWGFRPCIEFTLQLMYSSQPQTDPSPPTMGQLFGSLVWKSCYPVLILMASWGDICPLGPVINICLLTFSDLNIVLTPAYLTLSHCPVLKYVLLNSLSLYWFDWFSFYIGTYGVQMHSY